MRRTNCIISNAGDVLINEHIRGPPTDAIEILRSSHIVFANLEGPATERGTPADKWVTLKQRPSLLAEHRKMNVTVFNLANNHMLDYGQVGLLDTLENLNREGIKHVGAGRNIREALKSALVGFDGLAVGFLGFASTLPLESPAKTSRPGIAPIRVRSTHYFDPVAEMEQPGTPPVTFTHPCEEDLKQMRETVRSAKRRVDYLIVGSHWGMPFQEALLDYQVDVGHTLIDAGADLVIGNHPHRLQAVEAYRSGIVFHSLGNFLFDLPKGFKPMPTKWNFWPPRLGAWSQSSESAIVRAVLNSRLDASIEVIPTVRRGEGYPKIADAPTSRRILSHLTELSENLNVKFKISERKARVLTKR